jgi:hypothetical protein
MRLPGWSRWTTTVDGGGISALGLFTAGTKAGTYSQGVRVFVESGPAALEATATVVIEPGHVHAVVLTPSHSLAFIRESVQFEVGAYDKYGNIIHDITAACSSNGGRVSRAGCSFSSIEPGVFGVTAIVSDGRAAAIGSGRAYVVTRRLPHWEDWPPGPRGSWPLSPIAVPPATQTLGLRPDWNLVSLADAPAPAD